MPFDPVRIYDAPNTFVTQILDGEASFDSLRRTFLDPSSLSYSERDSYVTRLKEAAGNTSVGNVLLDVATNPFVWMMFLTSPAGASAIRAGARSAFGVAARNSAFVRKNAPMMAVLHTAQQLFDGTPITPALQEGMSHVQRLDLEWDRTVGKVLDELLDLHGLDSVNPSRVVGPKRALAQEIDDLINQSLGAYDREAKATLTKLRVQPYKLMPDGTKRRVRSRKAWNRAKRELESAAKKGQPAPFQLKTRYKVDDVEKVREQWVTGVEERLAELGATKYRDALKEAMVRRYKTLFGKEAAEGFEVDTEKAINLWRAVQNPLFNGEVAGRTFQGKDILSQLLGPQVLDAIKAGDMTEDVFIGLIEKLVKAPLENGVYMPQNKVMFLGKKGEIPIEKVIQMREGARLRAGGSVIPRANRHMRYNPDDLQRWLDARGTKALEKELKNTRAVVDHRLNDPETGFIRLHRLAAHEQIEKYVRETGIANAFFVEKPGFVVNDSMREYGRLMDPGNLHGMKMPEVHPYGRRNLADVLHESYLHIPDPYAKKMLLDAVVPRITSNMRTEHLTAAAAMLNAKKGLQWFVDSPIGQYLEKSSKWGAAQVQKIRDLADPNVLMDGSSLYGAMAKFLYVTHLGLNLSSMLMNLTQPLLLNAVQFGMGPTLKGYAKAVEEMGGYFSERMRKYGLGNITDLERLELIHNNFSHTRFGPEGENLIGIGPEVFETLETRIFSKPKFTRKGRLADIGGLMMKGFEKTEWFNRVVAGHTVEAVYRGMGRTSVKEQMRMASDIRRGSHETQFGANPLNTPLIFMPEQGRNDIAARVLSNPLLRMFLTFPLRSATGLFLAGPKFGGRENYWGALTNDFLRLMGIGAFTYELAKGTLGVDTSRGVGAASLTDVIGGDRFLDDSRQIIPIPPIVEIPLEMARGAMTGDLEIIKQQLPRLLPGGVAAGRLMGILPKMDGFTGSGALSLLQRTYADWSHPLPSGEVPLYKGDNTFVGYQPGSTLVLRGLGADMGKFQTQQELDHFLVKNRDAIVKYRQEAIRALIGNDYSTVGRVKAEFQKRFGIPLTVTKQQLKGAIDLINTPRTERLLQRLPSDLRENYADVVREAEVPLGLPPELLTAPAAQRREARIAPAFESFGDFTQ